MLYLDLVKSDKTYLAVMLELAENNIEVIKYDDYGVVCKDTCLPVRVSWETCMCHGGRIWINQEETSIHIELSSDKYDKSKGIYDPDTELAWRIEHELVETVKSLSSYVYVVTRTGEFFDDRTDTRYFNNMESASRYMFSQEGIDVNAEYGTVTYQPPNPNIKYEYKYAGDEDGRITFNVTNYKRKSESDSFELERTWTTSYFVFRKKQ